MKKQNDHIIIIKEYNIWFIYRMQRNGASQLIQPGPRYILPRKELSWIKLDDQISQI